ncbi:MAG TPA: hypothetical protein VLA89_14480, partial [Gemmatimonadales bacterium]|nr:hypothetical protein [Gemmatimonadales bacterium]
PGGNPAAYGAYPDGSPIWVWVTQPPIVGTSAGSSPSSLYTDGFFFFMMATFDGSIWRPYGDNQYALSPGTRAASEFGGAYNYLGEAFFLSDRETLLLGCNVSGLSPCIFRSTARGLPGTLREIVMPGDFFNYIPQGASGFFFAGLYVMTHCFCELDDGTVLCAGGAPTIVTSGTVTPQTLSSGTLYGASAYHYPVVWRSTDKGASWVNVSLGVEGSGLALEAQYLYEGRSLLALGGQAAFMACYIEQTNDPNWTPFFITEDGGTTFRKSNPTSRVGMFASTPDGSDPLVASQATFANDGAVLIAMARWGAEVVEIWRGVPSTAPAQLEHRAVGFLENAAPSASSFVAASIPEQELIRG